jgi:adenylate cyclase
MLLQGLDPASRRARESLLQELLDADIPPAEIERAAREDRLALLMVDRLLSGDDGPTLTPRQVAEQADVPLDLLVSLRRAGGLSPAEPDDVALTPMDLETARFIARFRQFGLADETLVDVSRVLGRGLGECAEAIRQAFTETLLAAGATEHDVARQTAAAAAEVLPLMGPLLEHMLRIRLREQIRSDAVRPEDLERGRVPGGREVTVCFADLVGFTGLGERVPVEELGRVARRLTALAEQACFPGVRLVKSIGDAVMLVSEETGSLVDTALTLIRLAEDDGLPELRVGLARGAALNVHGDWYGPPVNLASRLTAAARPSAIRAERGVREATREHGWESIGHHAIKGVMGTIEVFEARA